MKKFEGITGEFTIKRYYDSITGTEYTSVSKNGNVRKVFKMRRGVCGKLAYTLKDMRKGSKI
jgi:hypothetical protein